MGDLQNVPGLHSGACTTCHLTESGLLLLPDLHCMRQTHCLAMLMIFLTPRHLLPQIDKRLGFSIGQYTGIQQFLLTIAFGLAGITIVVTGERLCVPLSQVKRIRVCILPCTIRLPPCQAAAGKSGRGGSRLALCHKACCTWSF